MSQTITRRRSSWELGVTEEHLLGQKTAGFLGVAPGFSCDPMHDPEDEDGSAVQAVESRVSTRRPVSFRCDWGCDSAAWMRSQAGAAQSAIPTVWRTSLAAGSSSTGGSFFSRPVCIDGFVLFCAAFPTFRVTKSLTREHPEPIQSGAGRSRADRRHGERSSTLFREPRESIRSGPGRAGAGPTARPVTIISARYNGPNPGSGQVTMTAGGAGGVGGRSETTVPGQARSET